MTRDQLLALLDGHHDMYAGGAKRGGRWNCCSCGVHFGAESAAAYRAHLADVIATAIGAEAHA